MASPERLRLKSRDRRDDLKVRIAVNDAGAVAEGQCGNQAVIDTSDRPSSAPSGPDLRAGHRVQLLIPGNTFHTARITGKRRWFLGASTEWPGVVPSEDIELRDADALAKQYPAVADLIRTFPVPS